MSRADQIAAFLAHHGFGEARSEPLAQDASFRRYLRLTGGPRRAVLMDAPPPEDVRGFLRIAAHLASVGLSVPEIIAADEASGLLIEEDLSDQFISVCEDMFDVAVDVLVAMQRAAPPPDLPVWDAVTMASTAMGTLFDWWWPAMFGSDAPDAARREFSAALEAMLAPVAAGPVCFVHRDYFVGNLLWLPRRAGVRRIGVLDFQSAAVGHPAYDLVSLLQDVRRDIPDDIAQRAIARFLGARPELERDAFPTAFAACAAQRHLRVAAQWVRLARRDDRPGYLRHGPRTWRLLELALRHPVAEPLAAAMDRWIPPPRRGNPP